jgi:hypothetical protein
MRGAYAAALLLTLTACGSDDEPGAGPPTSPTASPAVATRLDWRPVDGSVDDTVTRSGAWTLTVAEGGTSWRLTTTDGSSGTAQAAAPRHRVSDALLDDDWAVVVEQDEAERRPSRATVTELASGDTFTVDGSSDVPTTSGGTWALGAGHLLHATEADGAYCLADVDLATQESEVAWCAPDRHGLTSAHVTEAGTSLLTFDDGRPSCRTVVTLAGGDVTPFPGATECTAWEGLVLDAGAVWAEIPDERRVEQAELRARTDDETVDLGPGLAGSLVACGGAAYFVRDPQQRGDPATLLRWTGGETAEVVYESPKGQAFLEPPRCGGDALTVTARTSSGDEQVTADL